MTIYLREYDTMPTCGRISFGSIIQNYLNNNSVHIPENKMAWLVEVYYVE